MGSNSSTKIYKIKILFTIFSLFFVFSCASNSEILSDDDFLYHGDSSPGTLCPFSVRWEEIYSGFYKTEFIINELNVYCQCVKVLLDNPNLVLKVLPNQTEKLGTKTSVLDFAKENNTIIALNTTHFSKKNIPMGITQIDGKLITPINENYDALVFQKENNQLNVKIIEQKEINQHNYLEKEGISILGGYWQILKDNQILEFYKSRRSRTAVGISKDNKYLYIFEAVPVFSLFDTNGLYFCEVAQVLLELGCSNAITFDGGTSTCMVILDKKQKSPFFQKKVSSAFGFSVLE